MKKRKWSSRVGIVTISEISKGPQLWVCSGLFCDPKEAQDSPKTAQESPRDAETATREPGEVPEDADERPRGSS